MKRWQVMNWYWGKYRDGLVVCAETEEQAKELAIKQLKDEMKSDCAHFGVECDYPETYWADMKEGIILKDISEEGSE